MDRVKLTENENTDHLELMRLLEKAKPFTKLLFPGQRRRWAAGSPLAQEIFAILTRHPEYYDEIRAHMGGIIANPNS